ncbi:ribonuclease H-like domain-containing protein [bacterium]|nr:ribonuclease H-like domain-containing protein [bacterium]
MTKIFIKGETVKDGLNITWIDNISEKRFIEHVIFRDYFYISLSDFDKIKDKLRKKWKKSLLSVIKITAKNGWTDNKEQFAKISLKNNLHKNYIKQWFEEEKIETFEADLNTIKRYSVDNYKILKYNIDKSPYLFYDLETDDRQHFKYDEYNRVVPENTILSFAGWDNQGRKFFFINKDSKNPECEKELLLQIKKLFMKYSIVSAFNGDYFDDIYLAGRCKFFNMEDFTREVNKLDYKFSYEKYRVENPLDSYSLDNIAKVELGEEKIDIKKGGGRLYKLYLTDKEKLKEYNLKDVELLYKLNQKLKFLELHMVNAKLAFCRVQLTKYNIGANDYFILIEAKKAGIIAPSNPTDEEMENRKKLGSIGGGYTRGNPGFYKNVDVFDYNSIYPSTEITFNISPEKFVANVTIESEQHLLENMHKNIRVFKNKDELKQYCKNEKYSWVPSDLTYVEKRKKDIYHPYRLYKIDGVGILPSIMIKLLEEREEIKSPLEKLKKELLEKGEIPENNDEYNRLYLHQLSLKYSLVSSYGLNALPRYRWFRFDVADSITTGARINIKKIRKFIKDRGFKIVGGDTDSIFIENKNKHPIKELSKIITEHIDNMMEESNTIYKRKDKYGEHNHRLILDYEKTFTTLLYKKKKRYAGLINNKLHIVGLESTQMNILASKLQNEFLEDICFERFDKIKWKQKLKELYNKCYNFEIEPEKLIISKRFTDRAENMKRPRAHTILAERLIEEGRDVYVGDKIQYIVVEDKPQKAVLLEEYKKVYPTDYYWMAFVKPLIELMAVYDKSIVFEVIPVSDLIKLEQKLEKETDDEKKVKLMIRIDKIKEKLYNQKTNTSEKEDILL